MEDTSIVARESGLHKDLTRSQIIMISLGGAIGTSLFLSSGIALGYAGPSVLLSYAITAYACYPGDHPVQVHFGDTLSSVVFAFDVVALIACGAGGLVSWQSLRNVR